MDHYDTMVHDARDGEPEWEAKMTPEQVMRNCVLRDAEHDGPAMAYEWRDHIQKAIRAREAQLERFIPQERLTAASALPRIEEHAASALPRTEEHTPQVSPTAAAALPCTAESAPPAAPMTDALAIRQNVLEGTGEDSPWEDEGLLLSLIHI